MFRSLKHVALRDASFPRCPYAPTKRTSRPRVFAVTLLTLEGARHGPEGCLAPVVVRIFRFPLFVFSVSYNPFTYVLFRIFRFVYFGYVFSVLVHSVSYIFRLRIFWFRIFRFVYIPLRILRLRIFCFRIFRFVYSASYTPFTYFLFSYIPCRRTYIPFPVFEFPVLYIPFL